MKIKKFRLRPRQPTVGKILKGLLGVRQLPTEVEASLPEESERFLAHILPAAFYQTWSREEIPPAFRAALDAAGYAKAIAVSALVATIGSSAEEYLSELLMNGETQRSQVVTAIAEECADLSFQFLYRLLIDDAKSDECEVSEPAWVGDATLLGDTLALVEAEGEGVTLDAAGHLAPRFTRVALIAWHPVAKKKRSAQPSKKRGA